MPNKLFTTLTLILSLTTISLGASMDDQWWRWGRPRPHAPPSAVDDPDASYRYVTATGAGLKNGLSWDTACDGFTGSCAGASLTRGNTYYVADGDYTGDGLVTFSKAASGTTRITIKKAIPSNHGALDGWSDTMGDGEGVFAKLLFTTGYWTWDGQIGSGTSGYGFRIEPTAAMCSPGNTLRLEAINASTQAQMIFQYTELDMCGEDILIDGSLGGPANCTPAGSCGLVTDGFYYSSASTTAGLQLRYMYIHGVTRNGITLSLADDVLIEYVIIAKLHGVDANTHGQAIQFTRPPMTNITVRYSTFYDISGTGGLSYLYLDPGAGTCYDDQFIYGNVFYSTDSTRYTYSPGAIYLREGNVTSGSNCADNWLIYNNTFHNIVKPEPYFLNLRATYTNIEVRNNVYVASAFNGNPDNTGVTTTNNYYYNNTGSFVPVGETGQQDGSADPFTNAAGADFTLSGATNAGTTLLTPYDTDPVGVTRGGDGTWDRGAYEYTAGNDNDFGSPLAILFYLIKEMR
jgi:hypothetical protein